MTLSTSRKWSHTVCVLLCLPYFTQHHVLKFHHVVEGQNCLPLKGWMISPLQVCTPYCLSIPLSIDTWVALTFCLMNRLLRTLVYDYLSPCFRFSCACVDIHFQGELLDHMVTLALIFWGTAKFFPTLDFVLWNMSNAQNSNFSTSLWTLVYFFQIFETKQPSRCEVVSRVWICIYLITANAEHLFMY